jgi:sigma-B regulation protein RsbU (phosphoserine phosphatase)
MKNMSFAKKLLLVILGVSMISMIAIFAVSYNGLSRMSQYSQDVSAELGVLVADNSEEALIQRAEAFLSQLSQSQVALYNAKLARVEDNVKKMVGFMENLYRNPDNFVGRRLPTPEEAPHGISSAQMVIADSIIITPQLEREMLLVSNAEYIFDNIYKMNPYMSAVYLGSETGFFMRYMSPDGVLLHNYDPRVRPWYISAHGAVEPVWVEPYIDVFTNELCTTCAMPYRDSQGNIAGIVAVDILLSTVLEDIHDLRLGESGFAFILDAYGRYLAHPDRETNSNALEDAVQGDYKELLESMMSHASGVREASIDGTDYYVAYAPLMTGWSIGIAIESDEVLSVAYRMKDFIDGQSLTATEQISEMLSGVIFNFFVLLFIIILVVAAVSFLVSRSITRPVMKLAAGVKEVATGNFDSKIDINTKDEIGMLAECFNNMTDDLKNYIENLTAVTAEKERIGAELSVATEIQADMLPKIFPPFSNRDDVHIAPIMQPAKEVGGDFYDFFFLDDEHTKLALVIADVSGKGVPAALFMVIAKVLIKNNKDMPVDQLLYTVNNLLGADNNATMFVTTYYSVLDLTTGEYTYASAGHEPPILCRAGDKSVEYLTLPVAPPLALFPNKKYSAQTVTLNKGDMVLLYTDGVTEAFNAASEMYGKERLMQNLSGFYEKTVDDTVSDLYRTIKDFTGNEPQSDDITMLCCRFFGSM